MPIPQDEKARLLSIDVELSSITDKPMRVRQVSQIDMVTLSIISFSEAVG